MTKTEKISKLKLHKVQSRLYSNVKLSREKYFLIVNI